MMLKHNIFILIVYFIKYVMFWPFDPAKNAIRGDAPEGSDTFQWPVIERDRVGGLRLIIWDEVKVPLRQYRVMHQKIVTCELHDSYFRLMTIKHSISKIQWAIVWALNYYLTQLSSSPRSSWQLAGAVARRVPDSWRRVVVGKATPDWGGPRNPDGVWGPEKMLIRCNKESQHPAVGPRTPVEHQENKKDTTWRS